MPIHTSIPEMPVAEPEHKSIQESNEDSNKPNSMQVFHHVLNNVLKIDEDEVVSFSKWMEYRSYNNFTDLCVDFHLELDHIHDFSDYRGLEELLMLIKMLDLASA